VGLLAAALPGCRSLCGPPGATTGWIVREQNSDQYQGQIEGENATPPPHWACRADTDFPMTVWDFATAGAPKLAAAASPARGDSRKPSLDVEQPAVRAAPKQVVYHVLGVGRGVDRDDCARTALAACDGIVDAYFHRMQRVRPLGIVCQLSENLEYCPK
jgi:hypothetical protein